MKEIITDFHRLGKSHENEDLQKMQLLNRQFQFNKRGQLFIGAHNEAPTVAAMCVSNEYRSSAGVQG